MGRYLGSSDGAISYLCKDRKRDRDAVIKVIDLGMIPEALQSQLNDEVVRAAQLQHPSLTGLFGMGKVDAQHLFVAMEFVQGTSLARLVAQRREAGREITLRDAFTVCAHLARIIERVHQGGLVHGVITPYNLFVGRRGQLKLSNLAFGRAVAAALRAQQKGPFVDSIYVAPELTRDPSSASPASDLYSLAMITVELLSGQGLPADRQAASSAVSAALSGYSPRLTQLVLRALDSDPGQRPSGLHEIPDTLAELARERGVKLGHPPAEGELPIVPAVEPEVEPVEDDAEEDLFNLGFDTGASQESAFGGEVYEDEEEEEEGRYLVQKGGLDYGPFNEDEVLEQLHADEIDEDTEVLDRLTQERVPLAQVPVFAEAVAEYVPIREERLRREAAARAELQRKVKKGGLTIFVVGIVAGLIVLAGMIWVVINQPEPQPLPMERAFASLDYKLLPPPKEFTTVEVDKGVMQSIFNPEASEAEIERQLAALRKKRRKKRRKVPQTRRGRRRPGGRLQRHRDRHVLGRLQKDPLGRRGQRGHPGQVGLAAPLRDEGVQETTRTSRA